MLRLLERDPHAQRLRDLLARFRAQELSLTALLQDRQTELEGMHREAICQAVDGTDLRASLITLCIETQVECDLLATEIVHVRMAVAGVCEEMAEHDRQRFLASSRTFGTTA